MLQLSQAYYTVDEETGYTQEDYKTYHYDMRGSTTALTDINGNMTDRFDYDPYGALYYRTGTTETSFLYTGQYGVMTDDNGLYYMRTRYYSPELKRFINADILKGGIEDSRTLNRYAYVNGNPVSYIDPFGTSAELSGDNYFIRSLKQIIFGNYTDDVTFGGTAGQVLLGLAGVDLPADVRDIYYDITHADGTWESFSQGVVDVAALLPVVGSVKYIDEGATLIKGTAKSGDEIVDVTKGSSNSIPRNKNVFPENPNDFNPKNLTKIGPFKTKNGDIIKWVDGNNKAVFEWDEDLKNGSHYHRIAEDGNTRIPNYSGQTHFYPGDVIE